MALHYVIDGYNLIHQWASLAALKPQDSRPALLRMLQNFQPQGSFRNEVTVVFDGQTADTLPQTPGIRVKFSYDETADDVIKRMIDDSSRVKSLVIVTDDRDIRFYARAAGAGIKSVAEFCRPMKAKGAGADSDGKSISQTQQYGITREMEKIWLREKRDERP